MTEEQNHVQQRLDDRFGAAGDLADVLVHVPHEVLRDLQLNLFRSLDSETAILSKGDRLVIALAVASSAGAVPSLLRWVTNAARLAGKSPEELESARAVAFTAATYNDYYKFRAMMGGGLFDGFQPVLRATPFVKSTLSKQIVELISVAVSIQNGCTHCLQGHVQSATAAGASQTIIDETVRIGAVMGSWSRWR